jgi:hypothetical protein
MPLPENFNAWEHLQSVIIRIHNQRVREEFSDLADDDDISTARSSLRLACLLKDNDSATMMLLRYLLFYFDLRKAQDLHPAIYGIPTPSYQEARRFNPQVQLYFQEDARDVEPGYSPVTGEISFRLVGETAQSLNQAEVQALARRINTTFNVGSGFVWRKGRMQVTYTDRDRGYQLRLLVRNEAEGRRVIESVLDIRQHTPDWKYLQISESGNAAARYPTIPSTTTILGKARRLPRQRPVADVRFQYALLHVWGLPKPLVLVDRTNLFPQTVLEAS